MSERDSDLDNTPVKRRGSGKVKICEKKARREGLEFVTSKGVLVEEKKTGPDCMCRKLCTDQFSIEEKEQIIKLVYSGKPKNESDTFLMGLINRSDVERHRPKDGNSKQIQSSFTYCVLRGNTRVDVCRKAFLSLHAISNKALQRLTKIINEGELPVDKRGQHGNQPRISDDTIVKIREHIESYPKKLSHYASKTLTYLDAALTVKKMYEMFLQKNPDLQNKIKYEFFLKYYKENYNYKFGRPQVDVCSTCEDLTVKMRSPLNNNAKLAAAAEMLVHKRRAKKFYNKMKSVPALCKDRPDVTAIAFDFMQNLQLPELPVQEMFYLRKLWLYVFCVHDLKTNKSVFYTYQEGSGNKGPNEVCTMLLRHINNKIPPEVKELYVFSDACGGQNRNHTLVRMLLALTMTGRFLKIHQYFPVRGHSFLPCDRNFATVKRSVKKHDRVYTPAQYNDIIANAKSKEPKFEVETLEHGDFFDFKKWWPPLFKKTTKSVGTGSREDFSISKCKHFEYSSEKPGYIVALSYIDSMVSQTFNLSKMKDVSLPTARAYGQMVPIKAKKVLDIKKILRYIPAEHKGFYDTVVAWDQSIPLDENAEEDNSESEFDE